jgi:hypothetical protein
MVEKVVLVSLKAHVYGGRKLKPGDRFPARVEDVRTLALLGRAREVTDEPPARRYRRRDLQADD